MSRPRSINESRDWTGYWIKEAMVERGLPITTKISVKALRHNIAVQAALAEAYRNYFMWELAEDIDEGWVKQFRPQELTQVGIDYVIALTKSTQPEDLHCELDTRKNAVEIV